MLTKMFETLLSSEPFKPIPSATFGLGLWFLFLCQSITTMGLMAMVPIMPVYLQQFSSSSLTESSIWASLAIAAPAVGSLLFAPSIGKACDRFGYRLMVHLSLVGFTVSMLLMAFSNAMNTFLAGRLLLGISGIGVTLTAFVSASSHSRNRGRSIGLLQAGTAFGAFLGPLLGGFLQGRWSLQPLLIATALFSGIGAFGVWWFLQEPNCSAHRPALSRNNHNTSNAASLNLFTALFHPAMRAWLLAACCVQAAAFSLVIVFILFLEPLVFAFITANPKWQSHLSLPLIAGGIHALGWLATSLTSTHWGRANDAGRARNIGIPKRNFIWATSACGICLILMSFSQSLSWVLLFRLVQGAFFAVLIQTVLLEIGRNTLAENAGSSAHRIGLCKSYLVLGQILGPLIIMTLLPHLHPQQLLQMVAVLFTCAAIVVHVFT